MLKDDEFRKIDELLSRGISEVIDAKHLKEKLLSGEKLRIKLGIDPTSPNIHLGRSVPILKLKDFQDLGHQIVLIIGDFTGVIGDTSDKESERPMLDEKTIKQNLKNYSDQAGKILDMKKVELHYNSEWLAKLTYKDIAQQANIFSLSEFIARENIGKRLKQEKRVSLRELLYPLMQGYDSVAIKADVELGSTDQRFNLLAGREMQRYYNQEPQDIMMTNLIEGLDGRKMSSSWGNTVNLTDSANDMFGKIMSLGDSYIVKYFIHCTRVPMEDIKEYEKQLKKGANPRDIKLILAHKITSMYWGKNSADMAQDFFVKAFQTKEIPDNIPELKVKDGQTYFDLLVSSALFKSKSEISRLFDQNGVQMLEPEKKKLSAKEIVSPGVVKIGKTKFFRIKIKK
jgi:tyrosyl-tRNA synthetase